MLLFSQATLFLTIAAFPSVYDLELRLGPAANSNNPRLNSLEHQDPVVAADKLNGVIFSDQGTVEKDASIQDHRVAVGIGVRVVVPALGPTPLKFDYATPADAANGKKLREFSFWVGLFSAPSR